MMEEEIVDTTYFIEHLEEYEPYEFGKDKTRIPKPNETKISLQIWSRMWRWVYNHTSNFEVGN